MISIQFLSEKITFTVYLEPLLGRGSHRLLFEGHVNKRRVPSLG